MNLFEKEKKEYEQIEIPKGLKQTVEHAIAASPGYSERKRSSYFIRYTGIAAAVLLAAFVVGLNTSESFAKELQDIPILGGLVRVLTVRSYEEQQENVHISAEIPELSIEAPQETGAAAEDGGQENSVSGEQEEAGSRITDLNAEIEERMEAYVADAKTRLEEYKTAFLETGGTKEEWAERNFTVKADYQITCQNENYVSFVISGEESWISAYAVDYFYNLDLKTGKEVNLKDLLGEDYISAANESILRQMQERIQEQPDYTYFGDDMDGFTTISDETRFYINEKDNPVIVFDKYEVAPGFMGKQEFEVERRSL